MPDESDDTLASGITNLILAEGTNHGIVPCEAIKGKTDSILRQQIRDVLKKDIQMPREKNQLPNRMADKAGR